MKKSYPKIQHLTFLFLGFYFCLIPLYAQDNYPKQKSEFWSHVQFGGGIGLSFGNGFFSGTLAPSGIYNFNEKFAAGVGLNFSYNTEKDFYESYVIGTSLIGLFSPIPQLQLSTEFEQLYINRDFEEGYVDVNGNDPDESYFYPGLYLGVGYNTGPVTMGIRFDVLYDDEKSLYANPYNPFVRFYF